MFSDYDTWSVASNTLSCCLPFCSGSPPPPSCGPPEALCTAQNMTTQRKNTVDRDIFMLKIIRMKMFRGVKFLWFCLIHKTFITVDNYNMDERLEDS